MRTKNLRRGLALAIAAASLPLSLALGTTTASATVGGSIIQIATANLGNTGSSQNSAGGYGYYNSANENWCADFAKWVWAGDVQSVATSIGGVRAVAAAGTDGDTQVVAPRARPRPPPDRHGPEPRPAMRSTRNGRRPGPHTTAGRRTRRRGRR
ncbi:hypothetical protein [Kitasatospora cinereorecta]|uniref:Uncharacterized protein n=1 Tax=Kitasatospora cinereorecta TaxID=285560 RepID=A0ABW0VMS5_9ACTN